MRPLSVAVLGLMLCCAYPAQAQRTGTFDIGAHARYSILDGDVAIDNGTGLGARLGYFVRKNIAVEFEYDRVLADAAGGRIKLEPMYLRLAYHFPLRESWSGILGGAFLMDRNTPPSGESFTDNGFSLSIGLQHNPLGRLGFRADVVGDVVPSPFMETAANDLKTGNIHFNLGLTFRFGGGPGDDDRDGVKDDVDACPDTPMGEAVDARGCVLPKDADNDGVVDPVDRCANTPAGTRVDATGCPLDTDRDGVVDAVDRCANTPLGTRVDGLGCPLDSDSDGVIDGNDRCPNTPAGTRVDTTGCPVPVDTDGDGVLDSVDACANTPPGTRVDGRGCPLPLDEDNDTITDDKDACPGTAAGVRVDARGCPIMVEVLFEAGRPKNVVLEGVTFATGKAELTPAAMETLDRVAASLVTVPEVNVEVAGYTDNTGSRALNVRLSGARAASVRTYLISKGVAETRITSRGYGPDAPVAPNTTAAGRAQNRRVELKRTN